MKQAYLYNSGGRWYLRYRVHGQVQTYSLPYRIGLSEYEYLKRLIDEHGTLSHVSESP